MNDNLALKKAAMLHNLRKDEATAEALEKTLTSETPNLDHFCAKVRQASGAGGKQPAGKP